MPIYEYKCPDCDAREVTTTRGNRLDRICRGCANPGPLRRVFGFSFPPMMHEHFNQSVGKPISSMRQYKDELKVKSEEATLRTGIEHRYVPKDMDPASVDVTSEGIHESNLAREKQGEPLLPEVD